MVDAGKRSNGSSARGESREHGAEQTLFAAHTVCLCVSSQAGTGRVTRGFSSFCTTTEPLTQQGRNADTA